MRPPLKWLAFEDGKACMLCGACKRRKYFTLGETSLQACASILLICLTWCLNKCTSYNPKIVSVKASTPSSERMQCLFALLPFPVVIRVSCCIIRLKGSIILFGQIQSSNYLKAMLYWQVLSHLKICLTLEW